MDGCPARFTTSSARGTLHIEAGHFSLITGRLVNSAALLGRNNCMWPVTVRMISTAQGVYRAFVINAKFMSPSNLPHINFMASCVVELFGLDSAATYEHAFSYIR